MKTIMQLALVGLFFTACQNNKPAPAPVPAPVPAAAEKTQNPSAEPTAEAIAFAKKTSAAMQGKWRSTIDKKSCVEVIGDEWHDVYDKKEVAISQLSFSNDCKIMDCEGGGKDCFMQIDKDGSMCFFLTALDEKHLAYHMIGGGKMQTFERMK